MITHNNAILLVDDSEDDVMLTLRALKKSRLENEIYVAHDGEQALKLLLAESDAAGQPSHLPLVIILDINMPKISGIEVLQRIRANSRTKYVPVVMLTTSDEARDIARCYESGANSFIRKPVVAEDFFKVIQQLEFYWTVLNYPSQSH